MFIMIAHKKDTMENEIIRLKWIIHDYPSKMRLSI